MHLEQESGGWGSVRTLGPKAGDLVGTGWGLSTTSGAQAHISVL